MIEFKVSKKAKKQLDKLIADFNKEKSARHKFTFDSILNRLLTTRKLDKILDKK